MEINKYTDIIGVVTCEAIIEGSFVLLTSNNSASYDFGSRSDLPGVIYPANSTQAAKANYIVTWIVPNQSLPMYLAEPSMSYSLRRGGFDQADNLPLTSKTVYMTWPGNQESVSIPSGSLALAFAGGVFTIPSGRFIYNAGLRIPGSYVIAANTADDTTDKGKAKYSASSTSAVAIVERFNTTDWSLQIRTLQP